MRFIDHYLFVPLTYDWFNYIESVRVIGSALHIKADEGLEIAIHLPQQHATGETVKKWELLSLMSEIEDAYELDDWDALPDFVCRLTFRQWRDMIHSLPVALDYAILRPQTSDTLAQ